MTRKDYIRIARAIRLQYEESDMEDQRITLRQLTYKLCSELKSDNYAFDREKFIKAAIG